MIVKCLIDRITKEKMDPRFYEWAKTEEQLEITVDKLYVVLAIAKYNDHYFYYLIGDERYDYPLAFPVELFEVSDNRISKFWDCSFSRFNSFDQFKIKNDEIVSFKNWSLQGGLFYERVLEDDKQALEIFFNYREKIMSEALQTGL